MFSVASNLFFALSGLGALAAVGYALAGGDDAGLALLVTLAAACLFLGVVLYRSRVSDLAPVAPAGAPPESLEPGPVTELAPSSSGPSSSPMASALGAGLVVFGTAIGSPLLLAVGVLVAVAGLAGWLGTVWREHPTWTSSLDQRLRDRLLVPFALPVTVAALVAVIVISLSRVLLSLPRTAATLLALVAALAILVGLALVAARPRAGGRALTALALVAAGSLVAAGLAGALRGERSFEAHGEEGPEPVEIVAKNTQFNLQTFELPAREQGEIEFRNEDAGIYHNVAFYTELNGRPLWTGPPITGIDEITYEPEPLPPGTYTFLCDFHINMVGTVAVT